MTAMDKTFRLLGWQGLVGMAVSGLDMAFWDALGQAAGKPVIELLGGTGALRSAPMTAMASSIPSPTSARCVIPIDEQGFAGIKIKGGSWRPPPPTNGWSRVRAPCSGPMWR